MPQGSWLGSPDAACQTLPEFKFIDVTVMEVIDSIANSQMQTSVNEIVKWSTDNHMNINTLKTKKMIIDFVRS